MFREISMILGIIVLVFGVTQALEMVRPEYVEDCISSEFNTFLNSSWRGEYSRLFNQCCVDTSIMDFYETKEVCRGGLFGIGQSCYESSESHMESYKIHRSICFNLKTGELS